MKIRLTIFLLVLGLILIVALPAAAQGPPSNMDLLRDKIAEMEAIDVSEMASAVRRIYENTLLRLYERYLPALDQQIALFNKTRSPGDGPASDNRVSNELKKLQDARTLTANKIRILRIATETTEQTRTSERAATTEEAPRESVEPAPATPAARTNVDPVSDTEVNRVAAAVVSPPAPDNCPTSNKFTNPPPALLDVANRVATNIVIPPDPALTADERLDELSSALFQMIFYSVADAVAPAAGDSIMNLEPYRYLYETARTDKQLSSSASSSASASAIDKPGFASWLGLGIENGQIEQAVGVDGRDTILTLSSSPVVLFSFNKTRAEAYKQAGFFNRFGISASFNIDDQDQLLANARRSQLREYSVRYRFLGDRSPRSPTLEKIFDTRIAPVIQARLRVLGSAFTTIDDVLPAESGRMRSELRAVVSNRIQSAEYIAKADNSEKQIEDLRETILCYFKTAVVDRVKGGSLKIDPATTERINKNLVPSLIAAHKKMELVRDALTDELDNFFKGPIGTLAYINHRSAIGSDYSEAKFLYEHNGTALQPLKLIANAGFSFYHRPDPLLNQQRLRDFAAAIAFEGKTTSPFTETENLGQITFSLVGRYERMLENRRINGRKADIASLQFLTDIPLFKGFAFPFSLTYSNATEIDRRRGWRANFAFKLDSDKLLDILRAASSQ